MKFNELKNEQAIEALADMFDPIVEIASDDAIKSAARSGNKILMVQLRLKAHARAIFELMATSDGVSVDGYECNIITLPIKLMELFSRPEFEVLFQSQGQMEEMTYSGSATENTEVSEK